jgi:hypothetical protein
LETFTALDVVSFAGIQNAPPRTLHGGPEQTGRIHGKFTGITGLSGTDTGWFFAESRLYLWCLKPKISSTASDSPLRNLPAGLWLSAAFPRIFSTRSNGLHRWGGFMSAFSRDFWRSNLSFLTSFSIHAILIIVFALCFFTMRGQEIISISSEADEIGETVSFDLDSLESQQAASEALSELEMPVLSNLEPTELAEEAMTVSVQGEFESSLQGFTGLESLSEEQLRDFSELSDSSRSIGFFGIEATGNRVVYILDISASMSYAGYYGRRYDRAVAELLNSLSQLREDQTFYVLLFCFECFEMDVGQEPGMFLPATGENIDLVGEWLNGVQLGSGTDPRLAVVSALERDPSCVFLLSDGEFNGEFYNNPPYRKQNSAATLAKRHNKNNAPINTIGLEDKGSQRQMMTIAEQSGGKYRFVSGEAGR